MKNKAWLFLLVMAGISVVGYKTCYWFETWRDHRNYPWAYSEKDSKRLVGEWNGNFTDPDGVSHSIQMTIVDPVTEEERERRIRKRSRRSRVRNKSYTGFDGIALITTNGKVDSMQVNGSLGTVTPPCDFKARVSPAIDDNHLVGFELNQLDGTWKEEQLHLKATFAYFRPDKSSFYDSANPKHQFTFPFVLKKVK